jgi:ABC-type transporter Mla MlaB component
MSAAAGGKVGSRLVYSGSGTIRCHSHGGHVTVSVEGDLDGETAAVLLETIEQELAATPNRIDVELCQVASFDDDGTKALRHCRELCATVPAGLHFRTESGPGQSALLEAFASEPLAELD